MWVQLKRWKWAEPQQVNRSQNDLGNRKRSNMLLHKHNTKKLQNVKSELTKSTMTKSSCGPDPSEPWEWRLACRGDWLGGDSGGWTCTHKNQHQRRSRRRGLVCASAQPLPWDRSPPSPGPERRKRRTAGPGWRPLSASSGVSERWRNRTGGPAAPGAYLRAGFVHEGADFPGESVEVLHRVRRGDASLFSAPRQTLIITTGGGEDEGHQTRVFLRSSLNIKKQTCCRGCWGGAPQSGGSPPREADREPLRLRLLSQHAAPEASKQWRNFSLFSDSWRRPHAPPCAHLGGVGRGGMDLGAAGQSSRLVR